MQPALRWRNALRLLRPTNCAAVRARRGDPAVARRLAHHSAAAAVGDAARELRAVSTKAASILCCSPLPPGWIMPAVMINFAAASTGMSSSIARLHGASKKNPVVGFGVQGMNTDTCSSSRRRR